MALDVESAQRFIVAHLYEKGSFIPRQDLLIDSKSRESEYSGRRLKIHSSVSEKAIEILVDDGVLLEMLSADLLEEIIRTGMAEDDSFTEREYIHQAEQYDGDSIISFGPKLNFYVIENFAELVEFSEEYDFSAFRDFCFEVASSNDAFDPPPQMLVDRRDHEAALDQIASALEEIERRLLQDNDLSATLAKQKDALVGEVRVIRDLIVQRQFRPAVLSALAKRTLGWISSQAVGGIIGSVATAAMLLIAGIK